MASQEHLDQLEKGKDDWNDWRANNPKIKPNLAGADLRRKKLAGFNLTDANLNSAKLHSADLFMANFSRSNLSGAFLSYADLRSVNLTGADLTATKLQRADLSNARLTSASFNSADLTQANLTRTQALSTDFTAATLTGTCLEDWNINHATQLNGVICTYFYWKDNNQERRPSSGEFEIGHFTRMFQEALDATDLIFRNEIDWQALHASFQKLKDENEAIELSSQVIQGREDSALVVRVNIPSSVDKDKIEDSLIQENEYILVHKSFLKQTELLGRIAETMAENQGIKNQFNGPVNSFVDTAQEGSHIAPTLYISTEQQNTLTEAAKEIQDLLKQLEEANPTATEEQKKAYVTARTSRTLRKRAFNALQSGGKAALQELLENPYVNIGIAIIEGWQEAE
jgi:uncharacterized protein YjbI with pentapeptide repeats